MTHLEIGLTIIVVSQSIGLLLIWRAARNFQDAHARTELAFQSMRESFQEAMKIATDAQNQAREWRAMALKQKGEHD
jgi:hypothetical protein